MLTFNSIKKKVEQLPKASNAVAISGIVLGMLVAFIGSLESEILPEEAVATVNGQPILKKDFLLHLQALGKDKRNKLTEADKQNVLNRLIEEELLVQRALELNFAHLDKTVRSTLARATISHILSENRSKEISDNDLKRFYSEHSAFFALNSQIWLKRIRIPIKEERAAAVKEAKSAIDLLRQGTSFDKVQKQFNTQAISQIPQGLLPLRKLRDYIGPKLLEVAKRLGENEVSKPTEFAGAFHILLAVQVKKTTNPAFTTVKKLVKSEYMKRKDDQVLKDYLAWLKKTNAVEYQNL